jgi:hypothetical protein
MVNGSGSLKIVDINYENDLTFIEFCFSRKDVKCEIKNIKNNTLRTFAL